MARDTRVRNQQVGANLNLQSVALQQGNRGFQVGVSDRNARAAQALQNAFGVGVQAATAIQTDRNATGRQEAIIERASGAAGRDADNKQAGYLRTWDQLDAEFDYNTLEASLPEILRGADAENLTEPELQELLNEQFSAQFEGIDPESAYGETLAPKLLQLEQKYIAEHRATQVAKIKEEQRTKLFVNAEASYQANPEAGFDHAKLFEQTGALFEGAEKKEAYWDTVIALAVEKGDPSILESVPPTFNGVPTGSKDPAFAQKLEAAKNSAAGVASQKAKAAAAAQKVIDEKRLDDDLLELAVSASVGKDTTELERRVMDNPESSFSDYTAAFGFGDRLATRAEDQSPNDEAITSLVTSIHEGTATRADIVQAMANGDLGTGDKGIANYEKYMNLNRSVEASKKDGSSANIAAVRASVNRRYNAALGGPMGGLDPVMNRINIAAMDMTDELIYVQGMDPFEAQTIVNETFDKIADQQGMGGTSRQDVADMVMNPQAMRSALSSGDTTVFAGQDSTTIMKSVMGFLDSGELTEREAEDLLTLTQ